MKVVQQPDVNDVVLSVLKAVDSGQQVNPESWIKQFPQFATELQGFFECEQQFGLFRRVATTHNSVETLISPDVAVREPVPADTPGVQIGPLARFQLAEVIGHGGMGEVVRAHEPRLERDLAIKFLKVRHHDNTSLRLRFFAEAKITASLQHPGVPPIHDVGVAEDGRPFIAMKLIRGHSLSELLARRTSPEDGLASFVKIFEQVAQTMAYVHRQGVIHRDLKPQNIMVGAFGEVQVMDWGMGKRLAQIEPEGERTAAPVDGDVLPNDCNPNATRAGAVIGTPAYMSPEQARGESHRVDERADVFGLGAILCEILTGRPPFTQIEQFQKHVVHGDLSDAVTRLDKCGFDSALVQLAKQCLAHNPDSRPRNGGFVADAISSHLSSVQERLKQAELSQARATESRKRRRLLIASLTILTCGSLVAAFWLKQERDLARSAESRALQSGKERRQHLFQAYLQEARSSRLSHSIGQRESGLAAIRKIINALPADEISAQQQATLRDEALASLAYPDLQELHRVVVSTKRMDDLDIDDDLQWIVHGAGPLDQTTITNVPDGKLILQFPPVVSTREQILSKRRISSGGRLILEQRSYDSPTFPNSFWILDKQSANRGPENKALITIADNNFQQGQTFFGTRSTGEIALYDLTSGAELRRSPPRMGFNSQIAISPDGTRLAIVGKNRSAEIILTETWETVAVLKQLKTINCAVWTDDGKELLLGGLDGSIWLCNGSTFETRQFESRVVGGIQSLRVSGPSGYFTATTVEGSTSLFRRDRDQVLFSIPGRALKFSRDGRKIAIVNNQEVIVYQFSPQYCVTAENFGVQETNYSPDGTFLCLSGTVGVRLLDPQTLRMLADLQLDEAGPVAFRTDQNELLSFGMFSHAWRWPITRLSEQSTVLTVGPPRRLISKSLFDPNAFGVLEPHHFGRSAVWRADGKRCFVADFRHSQFLDVDPSGKTPPRTLARITNAGCVSLTPDGKYIAGAGIIKLQAQVWESQSGQRVLDLPDHGFVQFSKDGRKLVATSRSSIDVYRVPDWQLEHSLSVEVPSQYFATPVALRSMDSWIAYPSAPGKIRICDIETGRTIATLTHPEAFEIASLDFSPDGKHMVAILSRYIVARWDLASLWQVMENLGLDASDLHVSSASPPPAVTQIIVQRGTELPPPTQWSKNWLKMAQWETVQGNAADAVTAAEQALIALTVDTPAHVRSEVLHTRARYYALSQNDDAAREDLIQSLNLSPSHLPSILDLCRQNLIGHSRHRDPQAALNLLIAAPKSAQNDIVETLLGIAHIRLDHYAEGVSILEKIGATDLDSFKYLFLAMAYHHLGRDAEADIALSAAGTTPPNSLNIGQRDEWSRLQRDTDRLIRSPMK